MAGGFDPNNAYTAGQQAGGDTNFPTSGTSDPVDTSLTGLSAALGVVPVAVKFNQLPAGTMGPPHLDTRPADAVMYDIDKMPANARGVLQQQLYDAGYYPASYYGKSAPTIVPGEIDPASRSAWRNAVEDAMRRTDYDKNNQIVHPVSVSDVINERIKNRQKQGLGGGGGAGSGSGVTRAPLATKLTNPTDIRATVLDSARKVFGHNPDDALVNSIIAGFQSWQKGEQSSDYNNAVNGGTTTAAPDLSTYAEQQVRASNPVEAQAHDAVGVYQNFLSIWDGRQ